MSNHQSRNKGTEGETFVHDLASESFLKFWCFPNPFDMEGDKKEICDLLIVFKDTLIICSVKNYEFKGDHDRYFRKTIEKAVKQISGTERKIFDSNRDIKIIHPERGEFTLFPSNYTTVLRLIVNLGEGIDFYPLSESTKRDAEITILDKESFEAIMQELNTISDLVHYLKERQALISHYERLNIIGSERDLLAYYLTNARSFPTDFIREDIDVMLLELDEKWQEYDNSEQVKAKREADDISYFVDGLVKNEVLKFDGGELIAKELMSLNRLHRRAFAEAFINLIKTHEKKSERFIGRRHIEIEGIEYIFIYFSPDWSDEQLFNLMELAANGMFIYQGETPKKYIIVGSTRNVSRFVMGLWEIENIDDVERKEVQKRLEVLGWFKNLEGVRFSGKEYPDIN